MKCFPWFNPWFSSPEWRFLFLPEAGKLRWGSLEERVHFNIVLAAFVLSFMVTCLLENCFGGLRFYFCFLSLMSSVDFCTLSLWLYFCHSLYSMRVSCRERGGDVMKLESRCAWEWVCASRWNYRSNWDDGNLKCAKTSYRSCVWCVWNSGSTHCSKAGQGTSLKLSSHS